MEKVMPIQIATPFLGEEEWLALKEPIESGWLTQGEKVSQFEKKFADKHGVEYAIAVTSCTTALHLALAALGIGPKDAVLVPSFTWVATANAVEYCGAIPIFCDCNISTYNIDIESARNQLQVCQEKGIHVKAIIPVHLFGLCANMDEIDTLAKEFSLYVVEDAACASGSMYNGKYAGNMSHIGCFSFHPRKVITTGEGGMCITNDSVLAERLNCLRNHGASLSEEKRHKSSKPYIMPDFEVLGYNYRMTDLQGALGITQLARLDVLIKERRKWAEYYNTQLRDLEWLDTPFVLDKAFHTYQSYVCRVNEQKLGFLRNDLMEYLMERGIHTRPGTQAVHELGYYAHKYKIAKDDFPKSSRLYATTIGLPLHNNMSHEDYDRVIRALKEFR